LLPPRREGSPACNSSFRVVLSDSLNHASMIEGIRHPRARCEVFARNDVADLRRKLAALDSAAPKLGAFESVYSMDGDVAPVAEICDAAECPSSDALG
jgi:5-aminolevulinate synthase